MNPHLRVLIVEDSEDDALLVLRALLQGHYTVEHLRVDTSASMQAALEQQVWDVVIADYSLPAFSAPGALQLLQRQNLDLPFIIVSGTVGEEQAVAAMKAGAHDYLIKGNLARLLPAVERELREAKERQKRVLAEQALQHANFVLQSNAAELEELYNNAPCGYHSLDPDGMFIRINDTELMMLGYERDEVIGKKKFSDVLTPDSAKVFHRSFQQFQETGWVRNLEFDLVRKDGTILPVSLSATAMMDAAGNYLMSRSVVIDVSERARLEAERKFAERQLIQADYDLQLANNRLAGIIEGTQDIIAALDLDFRFIVFNSSYQREFQRIFDKKIGVGMSLMNALAHLPDEQAKAVDIWSRALQGEEFTVITEFGDERLARNYYEITYSSIRDANGQIIGAAQMARDVTTRRQAEEELRNSEERYRLLFENNPNPMWVIDSQTLAFIAVNQAAIAHYGYSKTEFLGMAITDLRPPEDQPILQPLNQTPVSGQNYAGVWKHRKKDGTLIDVEILAHAFIFVGKPIWLVLVNDITERKQAEENLHIMSTALASAVEGVSQLDTQGRYLSVNAAYAAIVGYRPEELIGVAWQQTVHPDDRPRMEAAYQHMLRHGKVEVEARGVRKDGSGFYKQLVMVTTYDKQQRLIGHYCFAKDITERKQAEQKILEQAALLDITLDAICVQDLNHRILFWNKGAEHLYGWKSAEVLGQNVVELLSPTDDSRSQVDVIQTILLQTGLWSGEFDHITKTGQPVVVASRWTLMSDEAGQPKSILTVSTDVTEKKQLEAQFLRAQRLESLGTLASGIAHDFNNVLTPVLAAAQLLPLKLPDLDERNLQLLKLIEDSAKRGADLVKQILAFARGSESNRVPLQVRHLLAEVLKVLRQTFPKNIELHSEIPAIDLWTVSADAIQLHQVFMNLCVNARDAMPEGGILTITLENQQVDAAYTRMNLEAHIGSYVVITVSDTGVGIPPELMDRIFDPFFTTKEVGKGTGLGLSTVLGIVKKHSGFVKVYSEVGQGTQFRVYLPASEEVLPPPVEELMPLKGNQELILIVDDEPLIQQVAQGILEAHNYRTLVANEGAEAIALYAEHRQDIRAVLMDIMMPLMDGITAIRTLERLNPNVNVIATSGLATNHQLIQGFKSSVKAFLSKPYTAKELLDVLQTVLAADRLYNN